MDIKNYKEIKKIIINKNDIFFLLFKNIIKRIIILYKNLINKNALKV